MRPLPRSAAINNILRVCHNFHPNRFTSRGVIAECVNTVETRNKHHAAFASDFRIRAHSSDPELSPVLTAEDIVHVEASAYAHY